MKIAINKALNLLPDQIEKLQESGYEILLFSPDMINDVIEYTKKNNVLIYVGLPEKMKSQIENSISISTSTYVINNCTNLKLNEKIDEIMKLRKPSVEKIWNRNYSDEQLKLEFPIMSQNDYVRSQNIDPNSIALSYFGKTITYGEYDNYIKKYARILTAMGVKKGDFVTLCMANTPEIMLVRYSLDEIGAVANFVFPIINDEERLKYYINESKSKYLFILDSNYKKLRKIIDDTTLDKVVLMTPFESLPMIQKPYNLSQKIKGYRPTDSGYLYFSQFDKLPEKEFVYPKYKEGQLSSIQYTSGTTGMPKAIEISDDSYNARVFQYKYGTDIDFTSGQRYLQSLPICGVGYGEFMMQMGLANGMINQLIPKFTPDELANIIRKNNIQAISTTPAAYYSIINSKNVDLRSLKLAACGGDSCASFDDINITKGMNEKGFKGHMIVGNGSTEVVLTNATNQNKIYKPGTSGIFLPGNSSKIIDKDGNECNYNERGSIIYNNKYPMLRYHNNEKLTSEIMSQDGINMGDYGYIDDEGFCTTLCRMKDVIEIDNKEYAPIDFSCMLYQIDGVERCSSAPINCNEKKVRVCYIKKDNIDSDTIKNNIMNNFPENILKYIDFVEVSNIPVTATGKVDLEAIEKDIDKYKIDRAKTNIKSLHLFRKKN